MKGRCRGGGRGTAGETSQLGSGATLAMRREVQVRWTDRREPALTPTDRLSAGLQDGDQDQTVEGRIEDDIVAPGTGVDDERVAGRVGMGDPDEGG